MPFGRIVEEGRAEDVGIVDAGGDQPLGDVEPVPAVGDWHRAKEGQWPRTQDTRDELFLARLDARSNVGDELPDPMHRSGPGSQPRSK